jgi:biotin synthase
MGMERTNTDQFLSLAEKAASSGLSEQEALFLTQAAPSDLPGLFAGANMLARRKFKNNVQLCSIVNAKSGHCDQDCAFCAQSAHHSATVEKYDLIESDEILRAAKSARENQAFEFSIVTSGKKLRKNELDAIADAVEALAAMKSPLPCISPGILPFEDFVRLKKAGLRRYHHNIETARSHYPNICTTRSYDDNVQAVLNAKKAGIKVCSGGIFGMGETPEQRVEMAFELKKMDVDSVPLNFLHPIPGTPLEKSDQLTPIECLKIISLFRYVLPTAHIVLCGGREHNLRDLQSMAFFAGASGMMIGNYLTTKGRDPVSDLKMIEDLGLTPTKGAL